MPRRRAHVSLKTKLAAALACLLPGAERDVYRAGKLPADAIIRLFQFDHIVLHAPPFNGSDEWHNLDPKLTLVHREKSRRDTAIVAKTKRLVARQAVARPGVDRPGKAGGDLDASLKRSKFKRRIPSRPFPKSRRPLRGRKRT